MVKRYEFEMVAVHDMGARSAEDWEYVSGPVEGRQDWACLMRREVVPGRVAPEPAREHVTGTEDGLGEQSDPLRNCWTCLHSNERATGCAAKLTTGIYGWVDGTHSRDRDGRLLPCPPTADGCPGWAPKATP